MGVHGRAGEGAGVGAGRSARARRQLGGRRARGRAQQAWVRGAPAVGARGAEFELAGRAAWVWPGR